jgi:uncharacterized membrane protein YgcG
MAACGRAADYLAIASHPIADQMDRFTALFLIAVGLIYGDLEADNPFYRLVLPGLLIASLLYLFWFKAFLALSGAVLSYHYMDLSGQSLFKGGVLPFIFFICLICFLLWSGLSRYGSGDGGGGDFGDFSGGGFGDGGGGDGGGRD